VRESAEMNRVPRALCIFAFLPFDRAKDVHGVFQRMRLFVDGLAAVAEQLDVLFFVPHGTDTSAESVRQHEADLRAAWNPRVNVSLCSRTASPPPMGRMRTILRGMTSIHRQPAYEPFSGNGPRAAVQTRLDRRPSLIFVHNLRPMSVLLGWPATSLPPVLFDIDNIDHRLELRHLLKSPRWPAERLRLSWLPALMLGESRAYRRARRVFVCSEKDERYLQRLGVRHACAIPNVVDVPSEPPTGPVTKRLLFLGSLNYRPNAEAAEYLLSQIWPSISRAEPDAELWIAGREPEHVRCFTEPPPGVRFLDFVNDLDSLYRSVSAVVCPIRVGGGTRIKLVEAAAQAKPIVSTTVGAEGLLLDNDVDILLRDTPTAFAEACVSLLRTRDRARQLGLGAWRKAQLHYSRPTAIKRIEHEARAAIGLPLS